ncbi:MAG: dihydroorotase [Clostridiales bacterium]|nr:dihydroorotase [Clostridiales bacterium]
MQINNVTPKQIADTFLSGDTFLPLLSEKYLAIPGLCDVHVHFREPGFSYKETIKSGSESAAHGGYTAVCTMPNLNPVPDCLESLKLQLDSIERDGIIHVFPYGTITVGEKGKELSDMESLAPYVCGFSDDGRGVQDDEVMKSAMLKAKSLGKMIVAHCEVNSLLNGGYIHLGNYAKSNGHRGICSESEYMQIARDLELVKETGCKYHVCHISTKESVELIRQAKAQGLDVSCETAPHYLTLCDDDLIEDGRFKMNPPLRAKEDMLALIEGIKDGTIDMIATDHAPHSAEEKSRGLEKSLFGVVGLETAFPIMFTKLVKTGVITLEKLVEIMCINPRTRFNLNKDVGCAVFEIATPYEINPSAFKSMGKATPFEGERVYGKCVLTVCDGKPVYEEK